MISQIKWRGENIGREVLKKNQLL